MLSDSQSAVGILTLNWASKHYIDTIRDIKESIEYLKTKGMTTVISWTPGHANIQGNDEADLLAKQAAESAKDLSSDENIYTIQDVKGAAHKSIIRKWQRRWDIGETGRTLYEKTSTVGSKVEYDFPSKEYFSLLIQLRTGYCRLNSYKHRTGQSTVEPICTCGDIETVSHYLLECPEYEHYREQMLKDISSVGLRNINLTTLLGRSDDEDRDTYKRKIEIVADYIRNSKRFSNTHDLSP